MTDLLAAAIEAGVLAQVPHRGLPRERDAEGLPIPWAVSQSAWGVAWAQVDSKLSLIATLTGLCHVCGDELPNEQSWAFVDAMGRAVDAWVMHRRCARLAAAHCPTLRRELNSSLFLTPAAELARALRLEQERKVSA